MRIPIHYIPSIFSKYSIQQLDAVCKRDFILARKLGVSLDDYITLIQ